MAQPPRSRDFFVAIVAGGLALTGCSSDDAPEDAGPDMVVADAAVDVAAPDMGTDDADDDAFVAIL